jgi:hypothetical protein
MAAMGVAADFFMLLHCFFYNTMLLKSAQWAALRIFRNAEYLPYYQDK